MTYAAVMEARVLTSVFFGDVVVESNLLGSQTRIYSDDWRWYHTTFNSDITTTVPLDDLRGTLSEERAQMVAKHLLKPASLDLDEHYPGGYGAASTELARWLLGEDDVQIMETRTLTSLVFGNVVLESEIQGSRLRLCDDAGRTYCMWPKREIVTKAPLDEIRGTFTEERAHKVAEFILEAVAPDLDAGYPGGFATASDELAQWLLGDGGAPAPTS